MLDQSQAVFPRPFPRLWVSLDRGQGSNNFDNALMRVGETNLLSLCTSRLFGFSKHWTEHTLNACEKSVSVVAVCVYCMMCGVFCSACSKKARKCVQCVWCSACGWCNTILKRSGDGPNSGHEKSTIMLENL